MPRLHPRQPEHPGRLRRRGGGRPLLHRPPVRGGRDPAPAHQRPAPRADGRPLDRHPDRGRPGGRPRPRHRPSRPEACERHRHERGPGQGPRLRPRQGAGGAGRRRAVAGRTLRRSRHRGRRALRVHGLREPRAGGGSAGGGPPVGRLQPRGPALRDGHGRGPLPGPSRGRGAARGHQSAAARAARAEPRGAPRPSSRSSTGPWPSGPRTAIRRWRRSATSSSR